VSESLILTCVTGASSMPSSSDSAGLDKYGGDSGVASESWVWVESVEDDGSRSGIPGDAQYVVSSVLRQSRGPWACDECSGNTEQCGGQFSVMQPDDEPLCSLASYRRLCLCSLGSCDKEHEE